MKSESMSKHFRTLTSQRDQFMLKIKPLSQDILWHRKDDGKWSVGEHLYHLYLILRMVKVATKLSFVLIPYAKMKRNKPFKTEIHDIYAEFKEKKGRGMKAPKILVPPKRICHSMDFAELERLLLNETSEITELVKNIEEDIAGHILFLDPIAKYPNLIQAIQLLAIHEKHHFLIVENNYNMILNQSVKIIDY